MKISETQVLVVGAGAAGTMLGLELARHGVEFRLIDRLPAPARFSKAVTVHARTLEILECISPELVRRFTDRGIHSPGYVMHYVGRDNVRREVRPGLLFTGLDSHYPMLLLHPQNETEQTLRHFLRETYSHSPEWGLSCESVQLEPNAVHAVLRHADGSLEEIRSRYLVACDGAASRIRRQLDFSQDGSEYADSVLQNLDVELKSFPDHAQWAHYCMGPGHFLMVVALPGNYFRLLMSQPADQADEQASAHEVFSAILDRHFDGITFGKTRWHSRWQSQVRLAREYRRGNVFLAGDAAHVHSTAGGQGMNCCLQDAFNLGWKLALVLKQKAGERLLDSYEAERKPIGEQVIEAASAMHELFMAGRSSSPDDLQALRDSGQLDVLVGKVSGIDYHYRSDSRHGDGLPMPGDRAPNVCVRKQGGNTQIRVYDLVQESRFTLLVFSPGAEAGLQQDLASLEADFSAVLCIHVLSQGHHSYLNEETQALCYLVRPDTYVALRVGLDDLQRVRHFLTALGS